MWAGIWISSPAWEKLEKPPSLVRLLLCGLYSSWPIPQVLWPHIPQVPLCRWSALPGVMPCSSIVGLSSFQVFPIGLSGWEESGSGIQWCAGIWTSSPAWETSATFWVFWPGILVRQGWQLHSAKSRLSLSSPLPWQGKIRHQGSRALHLRTWIRQTCTLLNSLVRRPPSWLCGWTKMLVWYYYLGIAGRSSVC